MLTLELSGLEIQSTDTLTTFMTFSKNKFSTLALLVRVPFEAGHSKSVACSSGRSPQSKPVYMPTEI